MRGFPWTLGLGLLACVSVYGAPFTVSEDSFELWLNPSDGDVRFEITNPSDRACQATLRVELVGYADQPRGANEKKVRLAPGRSTPKLTIPSPLHSSEPYDVSTHVWDRLRYRVEPSDCPGVEAAQGEVSVSRTSGNLFHLDLLVSEPVTLGRPVTFLARAVHPVTGACVSGVDIQLEIKSKKNVVGTAQAKTDKGGAAEMRFQPAPDLKKMRLVATGDYRGLSQKQSRRVAFDRSSRVLVQTDKEIYQSGQTLHIRAIAFDAAGEALGGETAEVTVRFQSEIVLERSVKATDFGVIAADWPIPESAALGNYSVEVGMSGKSRGGGGTRVKVSRYETPPFEVSAEFSEPYYLAESEVQLALEARYFFGQPVAAASLEVEDEDGNSIETDLDEAGRAVVTLPGGDPTSGKRSFAVTVIDATTGRSVHKTVAVPVGDSAVEIEIIGARGFAGKVPRRLFLLARHPDGSPARCDLRAVLWPGVGEKELWRGATNSLGVAEIEELRIPAGAEIADGTIRFLALDREGSVLGEKDLEDIDRGEEELILSTDRTRYQRGEPVELRIVSSRAIGTVLVSARDERGRTAMRATALENGEAKVTLDGDLDFSGMVTIRAESAGLSGADALAVLFPAPEALQVEVAMSKKSYKPGEEGSVRVRVRHADGKPVRAAIGLSGVDAAIQALTNGDDTKKPDPQPVELTWRAPANEDEALLQAALLRKQSQGAASFRYEGGDLEPEDPGRLYGELARKQLRRVAQLVETAQADEFPPYPEGLERLLADHGVSLADYRDPWGQPFRPKFAFAGPNQLLHAESAGPDETFGTADDFAVEVVRWRYFDRTRDKIAEALNQTPRFPQTREELFTLLEGAGIARELLTDPWGNLFEPTFSEERRMVWNPDGGWYGSYDPKPGNYNPRPLSRREWASYPQIVLSSRGNGTTSFAVARFEGSSWTPTPEAQKMVEPRGEPAALAGIRGTVTDATGAVIPGTTVELMSHTAEALAKAVTDERGEYVFRDLGAGFYQLHFYADGFRSLRLFGVPVRPRFMTDAGCWLDIGSVTEMVTVEAKAPMLQTSMASVMMGSAAAPPLPRIRKDFLETVLWAPLLETDAKGRIEAPLKFADNITTWNFLAMASTKDGRTAMAEVEARVVQPLFLEYDPPTVLTEGDEVMAESYLRNYTGGSMRVRAAAEGTNGVGASLAAHAALEVASGGATAIRHTLRAEAASGEARVTLTALGSGESDAIEKPIRLRPNGEVRSEVRNAVLDGRTTLEIDVPENTLPGSARATLRVYPNVLAHISRSGKALLERPHGCGEQTVSSTFPNLMALRVSKAAGDSAAAVREQALANLETGYKRLLGYRMPSGGIAYFHGDNEADEALAAYALEFLLQAAEEIDVDKRVIQGAARWLAGRSVGLDWSDTRQVYAAAVLAEAGEADERWRAPILEKPGPYHLAVTLRLCTALRDHACVGETTRRLSALDWSDSASSPTPFHSYGRAGRIETAAVALKALASARAAGYQVEAQAIGDLVRTVLRDKDPMGAWWTTQTTIRALDALIATGLSGGAMSRPSVEINGHSASLAAIEHGGALEADFTAMLKPGRNVITLPSAGGGVVLAQASLDYAVPWGNHQRENAALSWKVSYRRTDPSRGEAVRVRVDVTPKQRRDGMLTAEIGLPPGAEVDQSSLEQALERAGQDVYRYEVQPDRVVLYLSPFAPTTVEFNFRPRWAMNALTAPSKLYAYYDPDSTILAEPVLFVVR